MEELETGGVKKSQITLLCANALHRKFTRRELAKIIGKDLVKEFGYRLVCHDAEDFENLTYLGTSESGYDVEINKLATYPLKRLQHVSKVFVAGAERPSLIKHLGFEPTGTVEEAIEKARDIHGKNASITFVKYPMLTFRQ